VDIVCSKPLKIQLLVLTRVSGFTSSIIKTQSEVAQLEAVSTTGGSTSSSSSTVLKGMTCFHSNITSSNLKSISIPAV